MLATRRDRACSWDFADLTLQIERDQAKGYTPSKFLGCDEELYLEMNNDYAVDPARSHPKASGTVVHSKQEWITPTSSPSSSSAGLDADGELENPGADLGRQRLPRLPSAIAMHQSG